MYRGSLDLLKAKKIVFENGLTFDEIAQIEEIYEIAFPKSLRNFLMTALPVAKGFYNWRNREQRNVEYIRNMINQPIKYINEMPEEVYWCEDWGEEPKDENSFKNEVKKQLKIAPKLVPIFSHRYMPIISSENPPVISVHGVDIIYYGEDLEDYFKIEFGEKDQNSIEFQNITPIPFWSDIM